jgi:hypothetical protein
MNVSAQYVPVDRMGCPDCTKRLFSDDCDFR